jgi:hypothetical protein
MAEDANDDGREDTPLLLPIPNGKLYTTQYDEGIDEVMETMEQKQKILAKIICVPGEKTYVADWMKQTYAILLVANPDTIIETPSGLRIDRLNNFPSGKKFQIAFTPTQSEDTKRITMSFYLTMAPALNKVKVKHRKLVDHLQKHKIYLDESFSGSDEELLIGYFMGIQADKLYLTGFSDDLREMLQTIPLQPGELELKQEARDKLDWNRNTTPPFHVKVRNVTRQYQKSEFSSMAIGMIVAKEHATFFKTLLIRACDAKLVPGLGLFYNVIPNNQTFPRIIKWHNDQIARTAILPIIGITREAMIKPIKAKRVNGNDEIKSTTIRNEIYNS